MNVSARMKTSLRSPPKQFETSARLTLSIDTRVLLEPRSEGATTTSPLLIAALFIPTFSLSLYLVDWIPPSLINSAFLSGDYTSRLSSLSSLWLDSLSSFWSLDKTSNKLYVFYSPIQPANQGLRPSSRSSR